MQCPTCGDILSTTQGMRQHHTKVHGRPLPNRTCDDCGIKFYDPKSRRKYCSGCHSESGEKNGNYSSAIEITTCNICGEEFEFYPSNKEGVYCSTCVSEAGGLLPRKQSASSKLVVECRNCGSQIERYPHEVEDVSYGFFCDLECYGMWLSNNVTAEKHHQWEGGTVPYGSGWWNIRQAALERDNHTCQYCGIDSNDLGHNPDVHHIVPVRSFENPEAAHRLDNVVSLCRSCHRRVEAGGISLP